MDTPENISARHKTQQDNANLAAYQDNFARRIAEMERLIPLALKNFAENKYASYTLKITWEGRERLAWRLCGLVGGADSTQQVYLLVDGVLLLSAGDAKSFWHFTHPYNASIDWGQLMSTLRRHAQQKPRRRFLGIF